MAKVTLGNWTIPVLRIIFYKNIKVNNLYFMISSRYTKIRGIAQILISFLNHEKWTIPHLGTRHQENEHAWITLCRCCCWDSKCVIEIFYGTVWVLTKTRCIHPERKSFSACPFNLKNICQKSLYSIWHEWKNCSKGRSGVM